VRGTGTVCLHPPGGSNGTPRVLTMPPNASAIHGPRSALAKKSFLPQGASGWPFAIRPWNGRGSIGRSQPDAVRSSPPTSWQQCRGSPSVVDTPYPPHW
jgi:hypothetical protein